MKIDAKILIHQLKLECILKLCRNHRISLATIGLLIRIYNPIEVSSTFLIFLDICDANCNMWHSSDVSTIRYDLFHGQ